MIGEVQANGQNVWSTYTFLVPADVQAVDETIITVNQDTSNQLTDFLNSILTKRAFGVGVPNPGFCAWCQ
ncbi:hypothetical protein Q4577_17400 [Marinovum sp. 2_MG-2023]|nr:hypothetical protein [Marinovum sp. 2_MG-2023]MDO6781065.1 hypothetical protein [Marinovum sp. 1_MG-2023]